MSEEIALAAADLATVEGLRRRILEWEDAYDRLAGAFELRQEIDAFHAALSDYVGGFYDVVQGELAAQAEYWRIQAADVLTDLHTAQAELALLRELADDVRRWREAGGDLRDQGYILETLARIEARQKVINV